MDITQTITHISLCAGYGGIDLGLRGAIPNLRTVAFSEIEGFACANLVSKMEAGLLDCAPIWTNLKTFPWRAFRDRVDILSGGYPCQPFSAAGKRLGTDDPRHLWPFIADGIRLLRPRLCFFENVEGHISLGLREVIGELESMGYSVSWGIFSARECGAPHQRKRVFILAMANNGGEGLQGDISRLLVSSRRQESSGSVGSCCGSSGGGELADSNGTGSWQDRESSEPRTDCIEQSSVIKGRSESGKIQERSLWPSRPGQPRYGWEPPRVVANSNATGRKDWPEQHRRECSPSGEGISSLSGRGVVSSTNGSELGNAISKRHQQIAGGICKSQREARISTPNIIANSSNPEQQEQWKAESTLGGDADGTASGMDYAELSVSCDNRTDELRLLGNGVVPATATLAFQTLLDELLNL